MLSSYYLTIFYFIQANMPAEASETLRELSPWTYVIVTLSLTFTGIFIKLYISEKKAREDIEKEFRDYTISTVSDQIGVSKDVIALVTSNKEEIKDALKVHGRSDVKVESILSHIQNQLERIETLVTRQSNP